MLEVLEHSDRSLAESAYCHANSEFCICTEVADVINLQSSTKCRLRGELRRRISPRLTPGPPAIQLRRAAWADRLELRLLFFAQRCVKILKGRAYQLDRLQHGVEPFGGRSEPCGWRDCIIRLAGGLEHVGRFGAGILKRFEARTLRVGWAQPGLDLPRRPLHCGSLRSATALNKRPIGLACVRSPALILSYRVKPRFLLIV